MTQAFDIQRDAHAFATAVNVKGPLTRGARLSRKAVIAVSGAACLAIAGAAALGFLAHPKAPAAVTPIPSRPGSLPASLLNLPRTYAAQPGARTNPANPEAGPAAPWRGGGYAAGGASYDGYAYAASASAGPAADDAEQAARSRLFEGDAMRPAQAPQVTPAAATAPFEGVPDGTTAMRDATAGEGTRHDGPRQAMLLEAGTVIHAALITGIRSDAPGLVTAQVTQDVLDSLTGRWTLIPQGARLVGAYASHPSFGQDRLEVAWTRLILPNGRAVDLSGAPATDPQGYAGLSDRVDHRWGALMGASAVSTLLGMGAELGAGSGESAIVQALRMSAASTVNQAGQQLVGKTLALGPRLEIRPGYPLRVLLTRDVALAPWRPA